VTTVGDQGDQGDEDRGPDGEAGGAPSDGATGAVEPQRIPARSGAVGPTEATDEHLMRQLYDAHAGVLLGYVRRLVGGDTARAEDVVQETLLRAWRHPEALDPERTGGASVRAWLLTVARHLVIDAERARKVRPREVAAVTDFESHAVRPGAIGSVDETLDRILLAHGMTEALATLTPDHRAVVDHLYYRDRSVAETAARLGVPEGTVKSRSYYALRALRVACEERGIVP
jgi:RNA polymerase sigma-70 factor (ECF subfamily)